ncbi:exonuclease domain-containing protein [Salininema proteolyticum]|uniref:Exonuclease domain-containing protein n=1 Tax=Salininema proteolyticum TaxID=1607685 RepID=A0ABV8U358_9ACTN
MADNSIASKAWYAGPLMGFDTETTGVVPREDRIVQAAVTTAEEDRTWLIDPGVSIDPAAVAIHGITDEKVRTEGTASPEALAEIADSLRKAVDERIPVVVYNAPFDLTLLHYELERHGIPPVDFANLLVVDPLVLDKQMDRYRKGKRKLGMVASHYGVRLSDAHAALADAKCSVELARIIGERFADLADLSPEDLCERQRDWYRKDKERFEAWLRSQGREAQIDTRWPLAL